MKKLLTAVAVAAVCLIGPIAIHEAHAESAKDCAARAQFADSATQVRDGGLDMLTYIGWSTYSAKHVGMNAEQIKDMEQLIRSIYANKLTPEQNHDAAMAECLR